MRKHKQLLNSVKGILLPGNNVIYLAMLNNSPPITLVLISDIVIIDRKQISGSL